MDIISALIGKNNINQLFAAPLMSNKNEETQTIIEAIEGGIINDCLILNGGNQCFKVEHVTLNYWDMHNLILIEKGVISLPSYKTNGNSSSDSEKFAEILLKSLNDIKYHKLTTLIDKQHLLNINKECYFQVSVEKTKTFKLGDLIITIPKYLIDETPPPYDIENDELSSNLKKIQEQYKNK